MTERYPTDATLLALTQDSDTGVEYISTGQSPYYLSFRRMLQRLLLATKRAGDLRVYEDGDLTVGVRPGRCFVGGTAQNFAGAVAQAVTANTTNYVYLDNVGALQINTTGFPAARTSFIPLAQIITDATSITTTSDFRGEALLTAPSTGALGLTATATEINQALDGIAATVTAANLDTLTAGPSSSANTLHRHTQFFQDVDGEAGFLFINDSANAAANMVVRWSLPNILPDDTYLLVNKTSGFLQQRYNSVTHDLVGCVHQQFGHEGNLTASQTNKLVGVVPMTGEVVDVILSVGTNIVSSTSTDGVSATVKVNGTTLCTTDPSLTSADGIGFRSTDQGDGTPAIVKSDGTEDVVRGDVLTIDLTRTAVGTVSTEAADVVALFVIRNNRPE